MKTLLVYAGVLAGIWVLEQIGNVIGPFMSLPLFWLIALPVGFGLFVAVVGRKARA